MTDLNPKITFQINLTPNLVGLLHPDRSQTDQDLAISQMNYRTQLINSYFPGLLDGSNIEQKSGNTFVAYGEKANYILRTYAVARLNQPPVVKVIEWKYTDGSTVPSGTTMPVFNGQVQVGSITIP